MVAPNVAQTCGTPRAVAHLVMLRRIMHRLSPCAALSALALALASSTAYAAGAQCPASQPVHYQGLSTAWSPKSAGDELRINLPAEKSKHYKKLSMSYDMEIGSWIPGADYYPISWVRNLPYNVNQQYDWFLIRTKKPHQITSLETEALNWSEPAAWKENTLYKVSIVYDAEKGTHTTTATGDGGTNFIQRPVTKSILPGKQGLVVIFSFKNPASPVGAPVGWKFSNLLIDLTPGGPFGSDASPCPGALAWTTTAIPNGTVGQSYGPAQLSAQNGKAPLVFSLEPGSSLPSGLSLAPGGSIGGTPTLAGSFQFDARVTDGAGQFNVQTFHLDIDDPQGGGGSAGGGGIGTAGAAGAGLAGAPYSLGGAGGAAASGWGASGAVVGSGPGADPTVGNSDGTEPVEGSCACGVPRRGPRAALGFLLACLALGVSRRVRR